jgi:acylpyruvate hydrolase
VRLATIRTGGRTQRPSGAGTAAAGTVVVRVDGELATELAVGDVGELLAQPGWRERAAAATGSQRPADTLDYAPLITRPGKVICVGLNYRQHILEMGRGVPEYPTLFAKFAGALIGSQDPIVLPPESSQLDWEAELAVVVGTGVRHADREQAAAAIGGYAVANDVTVRDWQSRTPQWLQGKTFESTTPLGPWLVTPDEANLSSVGQMLTCELDGDIVQKADTGDLVFGPAELVSYVSTIITLQPGDVLLTGTPGGVGHARKPPRYLADGSVLVTRIAGLGECRNVCRRPAGRG